MRGVLVYLRPPSLGLYLRVDDGIFLSTAADTTPACDQWMHACADALEGIGFDVPDRRVGESLDKVVGYHFQAEPARLFLGAHKACILMEAMTWLVQAPWIDVELLRAAVGVWVWGALRIRRELLAIPSAVFDMMTMQVRLPGGEVVAECPPRSHDHGAYDPFHVHRAWATSRPLRTSTPLTPRVPTARTSAASGWWAPRSILLLQSAYTPSASAPVTQRCA